jgi:two-component system, chemotaxis family, sensor kinase CheA
VCDTHWSSLKARALDAVLRRVWSRRHRRLSVGTKLSTATLAVVLFVAVTVYLGLSRYERRSLMLAKEKAAVMVTQLFAANLSAPLTFADAASVAETVTSLTSNPEIEFGTAWALDAERAQVLGARLGVLSRGAHPLEPPPSVPSELRSRFTATHVVVEAPVKDPRGKLVGAAQLGFSTAREEAMIADVERRVLWLSMGSALGLMVILSLASRAVVVRPLARLNHATAALERGDKPELRITTRDEIGELAHAFVAMSQAIEAREQRIRDRNRDMLRILDNAEDGFITVSRAAEMSDERSKILEQWFGSAEGTSFLDYFSRICPDLDDVMRLAWDELVAGILPTELLLDQMPKSFARDSRHFQLQYRAISGASGEFESLLVKIHDATEAVKRERAERGQKDVLVIFRRLMTDPGGWEEFFASGSHMVRLLSSADLPDHVTMRRLVHTLKGNCAVMGLEAMTQFLHDLEGRLAERPAAPSADDFQALAQRWDELAAIATQFGAGTRQSREITISLEEHEELLRAIEQPANTRALARRVASWRDEPVARRLERMRDQIDVLSRKLGKADVDVTIEARGLRLPRNSFAELWAVLAHVVRNAVDHGLQTAEERVAAAKSPKNRVWLRAFEDGDHGFVVSISDDGHGIAWEKVAQKAAAAGLPAATHADLERALFADSISTRDQVSETSGRGIGLGAVRSVVTALGGRIEIESAAGRGTTFRFALPSPLIPTGSRASSGLEASA